MQRSKAPHVTVTRAYNGIIVCAAFIFETSLPTAYKICGRKINRRWRAPGFQLRRLFFFMTLKILQLATEAKPMFILSNKS
ncbi:unnamed protein product [Ixodes persulcatus]